MEPQSETAEDPHLEQDEAIDALADMGEQAQAAAALMKALSNPTRLIVLCQLAAGEVAVTAIERATGLPQPTISQHLARLRHSGYVDARREGRMVYYRLADSRVRAVIETLYAEFCAPSD